jgi:phage tail-like protein
MSGVSHPIGSAIPAGAVPPAGPAALPAPDLGPSWLRDQLPRVMMQDPFLHGFAGIAQALGDTIRDGIDSIEHHLDVSLAGPEMLAFMARWLGVDLDPTGDPSRQRDLVRAIGPLLGRRGTVRGLEELLQALTGSRAQVSDGGGVYIDAASVPAQNHRVVVRLDHLGTLTLEQVHAYLAAELPVGAQVQVLVGRQATGSAGGGSPTGAQV